MVNPKSSDPRAQRQNEDDDVVVQTRALMDHVDPSYFMNDPFGAFSLSVLADIFVRLVFFLCTSLALLRCWRARERDARTSDLYFERKLDEYHEKQIQFLRSDSFLRRVSKAAQSSSKSKSSSNSPSSSNSQNASKSKSLSVSQDSSTSDVSSNAKSSSTMDPSLCHLSPEGIHPLEELPTEFNKVDVRAVEKKPEALRKRVNGVIDHPQHKKQHEELASTLSQHESAVELQFSTVQTQGQKFKSSESKKHIVIDIPVIFTLPSSSSMETGNKLKDIIKDNLGVLCDKDVFGSRILQATIHATEKNLSTLHKVAVQGMKLDKDFTLQINGSYLYYCNGNPEEPVLLNLSKVEVPTVLQADYSAGVLTIRGRHLEGAKIRATTFDGRMTLHPIRQDKTNNNVPVEGRIEMWRCTDLLPPVNIDQFEICARKKIHIDGHCIIVQSEVFSIQNTSFKTIIGNWVPTTFLIMFLVYQAYIFVDLLFNLVTHSLYRSWLFHLISAFVLYIIQLLLPSLENNAKNFIEGLKFAISSFCMLPNFLGSPTFVMRNGFCFQRGAQYIIDRKFKTKDQSKKSKSSNVIELNNLPTNQDWKWPCWREEFSKSKKTWLIRRFDSDPKEKSNDHTNPFTVIYYRMPNEMTQFDFSVQYVPQKTAVKLYSKYLQAIIKDLMPTKLKKFENYGEIGAKDLFLLYISGGLEKNVYTDSQSKSGFTFDDECEEDRLHMFHLIRFLKKEYEDTIKQHHRMMEAGVISWDMLWTLIMPNADVIYYCDLSKEKLCGKAISTYYEINYELSQRSRREMLGLEKTILHTPCVDQHIFWIELEVCDHNCINFEAKRTVQIILPFKEEVKITNMDVYPLQYEANSHEEEEFFLLRGKKYFDLVLKYERRFMHYQGLMYTPQSKFIPYVRLGSSFPIFNYGSKEVLDGRVMIDQGGFAKMKSKRIMGTAQPSKKWLQGYGLRIKTQVIDESNPLLKYAPAIAYGFSFSARKWGCFSIEGFSMIQFISTAFDTLVMKEDFKNSLLILSKHHIKDPQGTKDTTTNVDPLPNKGKGCIILLYGPPGTGKTLTVESLAEKLECPLWQLSISKLDSSSEKIEKKLLRKFGIAESWRAILVLDEADVYLSSRKYSPLGSNVTQNNAMTGVFLRVLEYYKGILFLTTNMFDHIEPAIYSRISLFVKYEEFDKNERKQLWSNSLIRGGFLGDPSPQFWEEILPVKFNGRVIRNIVQNAQILAQSMGVLLSEECLLKAFHVMAIPSTMSRLIESEEKFDQNKTPTIISTLDRSVVTHSTLSDMLVQE